MCLRSTCTAHKPEHRNQVFECPSTPRMWQWHLSDGKGCISKHHETQPIRMKCSSSIPTVLKHNQQTNKKHDVPLTFPACNAHFSTATQYTRCLVNTPRMWQWHLSDGKGCISKHHETQPIRMKCSSSIPTVLKHNQQTNKKHDVPLTFPACNAHFCTAAQCNPCLVNLLKWYSSYCCTKRGVMEPIHQVAQVYSTRILKPTSKQLPQGYMIYSAA